MRKNIFTKNKVGFSLIELCIVIGILAILAGSITPVFIKKIQVKAGEKTAVEMSVIQQAASAYFIANNAWPADLTALQNAGYLNPSWVTNNPWQNPYNISSSVNSLTVTTSVPQEWMKLVARDLPVSAISGSDVSSTIPAPGISLEPSLPQGSIIIWSGSVSDIPQGWALCDGANGTPDLRDRFVVGAGQDSGGISMTNVSGSLTKVGGEAKHTLTIDEMPPHTHSYRWWPGWYFSGSSEYGAKGGPDDSHQTGSTGGGQPHNNLPPYYALCFIMKMQ